MLAVAPPVSFRWAQPLSQLKRRPWEQTGVYDARHRVKLAAAWAE